jgi:hypothetical protein
MVEKILCATIDYNGIIVSGHRHGDCYAVLRALTNCTNDELPGRDSQGFLTSENRHVSRQEAWKIAKANDQIVYGLTASSDTDDDAILISENLY